MVFSKKKIIINIFLISLLIIIGFFMKPINVVSQTTDYEYEFNTDILFESNNLISNNTYNVRNQTIFTNEYNATYSFINDNIGGNIDNFTLTSSLDCNSTIIQTLDNHNTVIQMNDSSTIGTTSISNTIYTSRIDGIIDYWWRTNDTTESQNIRLYSGGSVATYLQFDGSNQRWRYKNLAHSWQLTIFDNIGKILNKIKLEP